MVAEDKEEGSKQAVSGRHKAINGRAGGWKASGCRLQGRWLEVEVRWLVGALGSGHLDGVTVESSGSGRFSLTVCFVGLVGLISMIGFGVYCKVLRVFWGWRAVYRLREGV